VANNWWYALDNQKQGPVEVRELERLLRANTISAKTLVWQAPMAQWIALERAPQLRSIVPTAAMSPAALEEPVAPPAAPVSAPPARPPVAPANPPMQRSAPAQLPASTADRSTYGGFWRRAAAQILDGFIIGLPMALLIGLLVGGAGMMARSDAGSGLMAAAGLGAMLLQLGFIVVAWLYFARSESGLKQATIGKRLVGLYVESADTSQRISFGRATGRFFGKIISQIVLYIGYLMVAFTPQRQGLHDYMAGTVVRRREGVSGKGWMIVGLALLLVIPVLSIFAAIAIPAYVDYGARAKTAEAVAFGQQAARSVGEYAAQQQSLPETLEEAGFNLSAPASVGAVDYNSESGEVSLSLNFSPLFGQTIVITPLEGANGSVELQCSSPDVNSRYLPLACLP